MAGHSKWANIKHKKARSDAKKGKEFSRVTKEIISAVKQGGPDQDSNAKLRLAVQKARAANLPKENIERNIKKATSADQADYTEITYELYGHGGVGIIVDVMTDNKNRSNSDLRIATNKCGGNLATPGAVSFNFDRKGVIQILKENVNEDKLFLAASEAGAEDFDPADELFMVITEPSDLYSVKEALEGQGYKCEGANLEMLPKIWVECDEQTFQANMKLLDWLEDLDDVDAVFHNAEPKE
ncbi:MAG: YebC/PmpR family DNA-binding regulatory protein [Chlamydiales bacterium]|jgi:YebC/PmpR family DNA-binding regulatory protein